MPSCLTPFAFVERLLEAENPIWYRWDNDVPGLVRELTEAAHKELRSTPKEESRLSRRNRYNRSRRLFWLLDRLTPQSENGIFEPFLEDDFALFAWGRQLGPERRNLLIDAAADSASLQGRRDAYAYMQAWCDSCPSNALPSLLDWTEIWKPVLEADCFVVSPYPEEEFYHRCGDRAIRYRHMYARLATTTQQFRSGTIDFRTASTSIRQLLKFSLKDAATMSPCPNGFIPASTEEWSKWLDETLCTPLFAEIATAAGEFLKAWQLGPKLPPTDAEYNARWVWVHCHGPTDWNKLHELASQETESFIFDHLAEITPPDQLDAWDDLVLFTSEDHGQMRAFCRWLPVEHPHVLHDHFNHPDPDWAACAYQCYLAKAPQPVLLHEWRKREERPGWQTKLLDRRLFGPDSVRPGTIVEDIQKVDFDLRLKDPFNRRGV